MSGARIAPPEGKVRLSAEQRALVTGVLGLAERVARDVCHAYRTLATEQELLSHAHWGIARSALTWKPEDQVRFEGWAWVAATRAIFTAMRSERRYRRFLRGRDAALDYLTWENAPEGVNPFDEAPESLRAELDRFASGILGAYASEIGWGVDADETEAEVIETARRTREALREAVLGLGLELRAAVALCFAGVATAPGRPRDTRLATIAAALGISDSTVTRYRNRALELLGARLAAAGITEMPSWFGDEQWGAVLAPIAEEALRELRGAPA